MKTLRYYLLHMGCLLLFLTPIVEVFIIIQLITSGYLLTEFTFIIAGITSSVFLITGFLLRIKIREIRTERNANFIKSGHHKPLTKQQRQEAERVQLLKNESLLSGAELRSITKRGSKYPDEELKKLIGMNNIKQAILRYKAQIQVKKNNISNMHMCFLGNPGTGKTTIAKILTGFLYQYKYIKRNEYLYIDGNFFKTGEDSIARTKLLLIKAKGKVLFVDEAYTLVQGNYGIGQQLLSTILNEMENNRNEFIVILAGYKKEMKILFDSNSGLSSRIKNYFIFEDYTIEEMKEIFVQLIHQENMVIDSSTLDKLEKVLNNKKHKKNFANARTVRNLAEKAKTEHIYNLQIGILSKENTYRLMPEDIITDSVVDKYFDN